MVDWQLDIENIGVFKDKHTFNLKEGLNIIIGNNATGKTSLVNAIKILNKPKKKHLLSNEKSNSDFYDHSKFLNSKSHIGQVHLKNSNVQYSNSLTSSIRKITEFLNESSSKQQKRIKSQLISEDPDVFRFCYIDKANPLMEQVEYSGSIISIKNAVFRISKIQNYEKLLVGTKKINLEYQNKKEDAIDHLHDQRKEIELKLNQLKKEIESYQQELSKLTYNEESDEEYNRLNELKEKLNNRYNDLYYKDLEPLNEKLAKNQVLLEKDLQNLELVQNRRKKLSKYADIKQNIEKNEKKIQEFDEKIEKYSNEKKALNLEKNTLNSKMNLLQETIESHAEHSICEYCLNEIEKSKIQAELERLEEKKRAFLDEMNEISDKVKELVKNRNEINDMLINQKNIPIKIKKTKKKIEILKKRIQDKKEKNKEIQKKIESIKVELDGLKQEIQKYDKKLINLSDYDESLKNKQTTLLSKINYIKEEILNLTQEKTKIIKKIMVVPEKYTLLINRTKIIIDILNDIIENFYFKFIDTINSKLENLLNSLEWDFNRIYVNDDMEIKIENKEFNVIDFNSLSGFERKSIAILLLAITKKEYFPDYPIFVIDEHLNSADPSRFIKFIHFLYDLMKNSTHLFIITSLPFEQKIQSLNEYNVQQIGELTIYTS